MLSLLCSLSYIQYIEYIIFNNIENGNIVKYYYWYFFFEYI